MKCFYKLKKMINKFLKRRVRIPINTYIGGVSSTISTPALLAAKLSLSASDIKNFTIDGSDISCYIEVDYHINNSGFIDERTVITNYIDLDGLCLKVGWRCFYNSYNQFQEVWMPNCIEIEEQSFINNLVGTNDMALFYMPNLQIIGDDVGRNRLWEFSSLLGISSFWVHSSLETINSGGVEGDIAYLIAQGNRVSYVTNFTPPDAIDDLATVNVYATCMEVDWTAPTSTNTIDYYEVYVDGVLYDTTTGLIMTISGLTFGETYDIKAKVVDEFYNKSAFSNKIDVLMNGVDIEPIDDLAAINVYATYIEIGWTEPISILIIDYYKVYINGILDSTTTELSTYIINLILGETYAITVKAVNIEYSIESDFSNGINVLMDGTNPPLPVPNIISEYKFENNVLDTVGANDGVATAITYETGGVSKSGVFNGSTSKIIISDADNLSFTDGINDLPFSISFLVNLDSKVDQMFINKLVITKREWYVYYNGSKLKLHLDGGNGNGSNYITFESDSTIDLTSEKHIVFTYDASEGITGCKMYVDGVLFSNTGVMSGTYAGMTNFDGEVVIGKHGDSGSNILYVDGLLDVVRIWDKELDQTEITELATQELIGVDINP